MPAFLNNLFSSGPFIPHGHCYLWQPGLVWLHLLADALIALAYYSIPITLLYFVRKRDDLPFSWVFLLFGSFIIACGTTHLMEIWTLWHPTYWLSGTLKAATAMVSVYTALELIPLVPQALALPSPAQLKAANQALQQQILEREQAEKQIQALNAELEQRVSARTEQLEAANRAKDEFLSILSHELRTPLNAMLGWARLLRSRQLNEAKAEHAIETIERNAKLQAQLIDDILDISRIIQGKLRLNVRPVELAAVVEAAIDVVRPAADAKAIRIQTILDPFAGSVSGDSDRLQQVMWNLLSNAVKFTPGGGQVQVCLERINSHVEITVSDTGQGITADFLPYIFDRFSQSDSSTTRVQNGLGLGLAIVRTLVELHGGSVYAESTGDGQGSTFKVSLPLMMIPGELKHLDRLRSTAGDEVGFPGTSVLSGLQVLVVDDEVDARRLVTAVLEQCGASVTSVASASEALEAIERLQPHVLLSDIGMPHEDGYALIRKVRELALEQGGTIPAIALTAYARLEDRIQALSAGFQMHIPKPIEPAELVAAVVNVAGRTGQIRT
ncbi:response regulator [Trichocoleus sp. FACHB-591]|uniref:hybrid sensor histidine kinase/response regulator n=1 Tax=Trichocoleus sp. FACHB-591 TaxID=2692872 RepID=UPI0016883B64|nr:ATP-binding protein [Trichocoleus sp. FACHB-591]MBD2096908.1 response regulator [Trichocoleus sp. FACHB-591]